MIMKIGLLGWVLHGKDAYNQDFLLVLVVEIQILGLWDKLVANEPMRLRAPKAHHWIMIPNQ